MPEEPTATTAKTFALEECKKHITERSCWLIIHGKVYDVTDFLEEHPGGYDIVVASAGKDATQDFEEIGHSNSARQILSKYLIGDYAGGDSAPAERISSTSKVHVQSGPGPLMRTFQVLLPLLVILAALLYSQMQQRQ